MCESVNLTNSECRKVLQQVKGSKASLVSFCLNSLGEAPVGFLGNHYRLTVKYKEDESGTSDCPEETLSFFVKTVPSLPAHAQYVEEFGVFKKETSLFDKLIPKLLNATSFLTLPWAPKCFFVKDNNMLIFEDLSMKNYQLASGREILNIEHCTAAIKTLADFHASSIIWEDNNKKYTLKYRINQAYPELVKELAYVTEEGHTREKWLSACSKALQSICRMMGREEDAHLLPDIIRNSVKDVGASEKLCNVLSHGDLWSNNFMFKYDSEGTVLHCSLVDFQLARYAPCQLDLACCLHLIATRKLREMYMSQLLNIYYERLQNVLSHVGLNINKYITREQLDTGCQNFKATALSEACLFGVSIWIPSKLAEEVLSSPAGCEEITNGNRVPLVEKAFRQDNFFKTQMSELIEELLSHYKSSLSIV